MSSSNPQNIEPSAENPESKEQPLAPGISSTSAALDPASKSAPELPLSSKNPLSFKEAVWPGNIPHAKTTRGFRVFNLILAVLLLLLVILVVVLWFSKPTCLSVSNANAFDRWLKTQEKMQSRLTDSQNRTMEMQVKAIDALNRAVTKLDGMLTSDITKGSHDSRDSRDSRDSNEDIRKGPREHLVAKPTDSNDSGLRDRNTKRNINPPAFRTYIGGGHNVRNSYNPGFEHGSSDSQELHDSQDQDNRVSEVMSSYKRNTMLNEAQRNLIRADAVTEKDYAPNYDLFEYL